MYSGKINMVDNPYIYYIFRGLYSITCTLLPMYFNKSECALDSAVVGLCTG